MSAETHLTKIAVFKGKQIRRHWDEATEKWYFSVVEESRCQALLQGTG